MEGTDSLSIAVFTGDFISPAPHLVAWTAAIVLAVIMLRRGGGKAEKLFLVGSGLMLVSTLASPLLMGLWTWLAEEQRVSRAASGWIVSLPLSILTVAGFVCLVYAFWMMFMTKIAKEDMVKKGVV